MYFHAKRAELPWGGFRLQKTFRGYDAHQDDGVAATIFGFINGIGREGLPFPDLPCWGSSQEMQFLGFPFLRMFRCESTENICGKPQKGDREERPPTLTVVKRKLKGGSMWGSSQGEKVPSSTELFNLVDKWCKTKPIWGSWNETNVNWKCKCSWNK